MMQISKAIASADGLFEDDAELVRSLVDEWQSKHARNVLRDQYYNSHVPVKDLGVSVSPQMAKKLNPRVDWAAKCVDYWADRTQFEGITSEDESQEEILRRIVRQNDVKNLIHKVISSALRHSCAFLTVTAGNTELGEPTTVISGYPATAATAIWDEAKKRISAGMVVVETAKFNGSQRREPKLIYVFTDEYVIILSREIGISWQAEYVPHSMGRVPMEPIAYHATLERPFGRSRITRTVMSLVDDAQREMMNMAAAAAFSAAPQKYLLGADKPVAEKIAGSPFEAFIGSIFMVTEGKSGKIPNFGQLPQITMQPHTEYLRALAAQFSGSTGVPLQSLGVVTDNPSSAEAIDASKEDAVVDIKSFTNACKRSIETIAVMALASENNVSYMDALGSTGAIAVNFANPAMPSIVSQSDAMIKQISAMPWLAESDIALRELGYTDEQIMQLRSDRRKAQVRAGANAFLDKNQANAEVADADENNE